MSSNPTISVIIPAYNAADTLRHSVESVLQQSYTDYEILVVDDASDDDVASALADIQDSRLQILKHEQNKGAAAARNTGIATAKGHYVAFLDSDDVWLPAKLETQHKFMSEADNAQIRASCTSFSMVRLNNHKCDRLLDPAKDWNDVLLGGCGVSPGSTLMAETALFSPDEIGVYPAELRRLEDWDWLLTYIRRYRLGIIPAVLTEVRVSGYPAYETVHQAAAQLHQKQSHQIEKRFGKAGLKKFRAGLEIENAGAAFRNKLYITAIKHAVLAAIASPARFWSLMKRILEKLVKRDYSGA